MSIRPKWAKVFAAQAKPMTSISPIPGSPSALTPVNTVVPARFTKSVKPPSVVYPVRDSFSAGISTMPPAVNITISQGVQMVANSATTLNP